MKRRHLLAATLLLVAAPCAAPGSADQARPYGRATVALVQADGETPLEPTSKAADGSSVVVYLDANSPTVALVAAFTRKDRRPVEGWLPELIELEEWEPQRIPRKPKVWAWKDAGEALEVQAFFLAADTPGLDKLRALIAAMGKEKRTAALAKLQERQLRELVAPWLANEGAVAARPADAPARIGGTVRAAGAEFPWRDYARSANFSAERPGVVTFRHDGR